MKTLILSLILTSVCLSQSYEIEKINGNVKIITSSDNTWQVLNYKIQAGANTLVSTDKNSSAKIMYDNFTFTLKESSAISVSNIKKMSIDDLLLALAMENIINTPKKNGNNKSENTVVYGNKVSEELIKTIQSTDFGLKRLNGAVQLAENGLIESAIITSKEIFRKYPETKNLVDKRIYFAELLYEKGLYEESLEDYKTIKKLVHNKEQELKVDNKIEEINRKLLNK